MSSFSVALPLTKDPGDGFTMIKNFKSLVRQNLKMLILTVPGERVMEPTFGVGLKTFLFENFQTNTFSDIEAKIRQQVNTFMPAVRIISVDFDTVNIDRNKLGIALKYSIPNISATEMLEFTI